MSESCSYCGGSMRVAKLTCQDCDLSLEGAFESPRTARLSRDQQRFIELFVLSSGSLKEMAKQLDISYPTVRNRLDKIIEALETERLKDRERKQHILDDIEAGRISAKHGMRLIDAL